MRYLSGLVVLALLNACGSSDSDGVGGVSASEARALNEAAATLDARVGVTEDGASGLNPAARMAADRQRGAAPAAETTR
ncbi:MULTISPECIES: hypothetical protein [Sphingobium]|jgi:hypothetical protein|uniref:hypothetical protein n=1 Tax=Sphingobium TaxID=165695 RepID=UPI000C3FD7C9|nr:MULTISPECIES: hypothetical protein [Sphingobium]MEC9016895.1 hypothetical protein [Pseudomonadota bacterium]MAP45799.1 hypothetical protein [Sphingobium sp.]MAX15274.1 hypothetical protein [Sphingobium sp.]MBA38041.1 hypothetical protein [Sphingobium sp.]MBS48121.1 hypothetical protein [Sphingobium sp.]|tara:strand:- start:251 stop:487 length:237 start_codon:yes stop_codon:yes gene_type:complete